MRVIDPVQQALSTLHHETAHAVVARYFGWRILRVVVDRDHVDVDHALGVASFVPPDDEIESVEEMGRQAAIILLAGKMQAEGPSPEQHHHPNGDDTKAREIWRSMGSPPGWMERQKTEAFILLRRREVVRAMRVLSTELQRARGVLDGALAEQIIDAALRGD